MNNEHILILNLKKMTVFRRQYCLSWLVKIMHWWMLWLVVTQTYVHGQDLSACCTKGDGTCKNVCLKMSMVEKALDTSTRDDRIQNIHKFCGPHLTDFWICMNQTMKELVSGSGWWGRVCCGRGRSAACRQNCVTAPDSNALQTACRRSDEVDLFDCVQTQQEAQWCCSQTFSLTCHEACHQALWQVSQTGVKMAAKERVTDTCEQSPDLLQCFANYTATTDHNNADKYIPCCSVTSNLDCRRACESTLRGVRDSNEIFRLLERVCDTPSLYSPFWQCFLKKDAPPDESDVMPHDATKLHCCYKATTIHCRRVCLQTYGFGWQTYWQVFEESCIADPLETKLSQCIEEVQAPCSLGCNGLTYCNHMNNRPTTLFRSCDAQADFQAHIAVVNQHESGFVEIAGMQLPLRNTSQCPTDLWKNVACALHVKPCTRKGQVSHLCPEDCFRVVSACVDWSRANPRLSAMSLCQRIAPANQSEPCVQRQEFSLPSPIPALLSPEEAVRSPCAGHPCDPKQICVVNRNCAVGAVCAKYSCVDGCPLGIFGSVVAAQGSWVRIPMFKNLSDNVCYNVCRCGRNGLTQCQPLPCYRLDSCTLHDKTVPHGDKFYMECNECTCHAGERICSGRACLVGGGGALLTRLPCNCPPHHLPTHTGNRHYPNACLAKCAGATDGEIEFGRRLLQTTVRGKIACLPKTNICLSRLQVNCPQHLCANITNCNSQPLLPVCDTFGDSHANPCFLMMSGRTLAYWGECLLGCLQSGQVCGLNGVTYSSECAAWAEYVTVDYPGPCVAVGPISNSMEPKCKFDRILCPPLKNSKCLGFTAPGSCCPKCGGALRILYSKKEIDRALYGTNISASVINLNNVLKALDRHVKIAECTLRGYLTIETEVFISVESTLANPTDLQLTVCVLEAEKIADLINRESPLITSDLSLSPLLYALVVHNYANSVAIVTMSMTVLFLSISLSFILI